LLFVPWRSNDEVLDGQWLLKECTIADCPLAKVDEVRSEINVDSETVLPSELVMVWQTTVGEPNTTNKKMCKHISLLIVIFLIAHDISKAIMGSVLLDSKTATATSKKKAHHISGFF